MSNETNGYLDSDQTIINFAVRELGISFQQLLVDDPSRMLRNWLKCRKTAQGTAIGTTILGALAVTGSVLTGAMPLMVAGVAVAAVSGFLVKHHSKGASACELEMVILDECRPILSLMAELERRGANSSDLVSVYDKLVRAASINHFDVTDKDRLQGFFQRELQQSELFSKLAGSAIGLSVGNRQQNAGALPPETQLQLPATQTQDEDMPDVSPGEFEPIEAPETFDIPVESVPSLQPPAQSDDRFLWAKDLLNFPAVLIWGPQGSGKTSFAAWLLRERIQAGHTAEVWDVHREYGQWEGLPVFGDGMDYEAVDRRMLAFESRVKADYKERAINPKYNPKRHTIVCEEFTNFARRCEHSAPFFEASLSDLRKVKKGVIFVSHDRSLVALGGSKGFSKARNNGLLELQLEAKIDSTTGDPMPALKGKLKYPGKGAIEVELATWMNGDMNFTTVVHPASKATSASTSDSLPPTSTSQQPEVTSEAVSRLEALYSRDGSEVTSTSHEGDRTLYEAVKALLEAGKSKTWIVENVLGCKGRKFEQGKTTLEALLKQFEG